MKSEKLSINNYLKFNFDSVVMLSILTSQYSKLNNNENNLYRS